jgi:WD40 repeat protein
MAVITGVMAICLWILPTLAFTQQAGNAGFQLVRTIPVGQWLVDSIAATPDGQTLISNSRNSSNDISGNTTTNALIQAWQISDGKQLYSIDDMQLIINSLAVSPDGKTMVSDSQHTINGDNRFVNIKHWRLADGKLLRSRRLQPYVESNSVGAKFTVTALAMSADGKTIASGSTPGTIYLLRLSDGKLLRQLKSHQEPISEMAISADGRILVSSSGDRTVKVWRLADGRLLRTLKNDQRVITALAIARDGKTIFSGSNDGMIKVWRTNDGKLLRTINTNEESIYSLAVGFDGKTLISGGFSTKVWRILDGQLLQTIETTRDHGYVIAINPNPRTIITASSLSTNKEEGAIEIWQRAG